MEGTFRFFNTDKNFGFLTTDDGNDVFVHGSAVLEGGVPKEGQRAQFTVEDGPKGKRAAALTLLNEFREVPESSAPRKQKPLHRSSRRSDLKQYTKRSF